MSKKISSNDDASTPYRLSSVASALRLLKSFTAEESELGITTLAQRMGLAKSTIHRLTSTLLAEGFLEQNPLNEKYRLGLSLFGLGTLVRRRMNVSSEALEHLHELRDRTGETVHLAVLEQADIMYLFNLESQQAIGMRSYLGVRKPAFCSSEGRAILAFSPPALVSRVLKSALLARTPHTIIQPAALIKLLAGVAHAGYAVDDEESDAGMRGLAAPIRDASGTVIAAVGLAGPVQRLSKKNLRSYTPWVLQAAQAISTRLGYRPD
jgi:DNA-binding IclR family transcriptional regulator